MPTTKLVQGANPKPCARCPWRLENQGKPHPDGWYTKRNRDRLWAKLRRGESMTCHPTDPENLDPHGTCPVPEDATTHECAGALILQQREVMVFQGIAKPLPPIEARRAYRRQRPKGLTIDGLSEIVARYLFGGTPLAREMRKNLDLDEPVGHEPLPWGDHERALARSVDS